MFSIKILRFLSIFLLSITQCVFANELDPWSEPSCGFEKTDLKFEPEELIKEFLTKDSTGQFLRTNSWFNQAIVCPGYFGGPDTFMVIKKYRITDKKIDKESAQVSVEYDVVGVMGSGGSTGEFNSFSPKVETIKTIIKVIKTPFGWKINNVKGGLLYQMVLPEPAVKNFHQKWVPGDQEKFLQAVEIKTAAENGDAWAQLEYGKSIMRESREEASRWIQKAADQGSAEAIFWLGYAGFGKEKSVFYYEKAAEKGYPEAFDSLLEHVLFRAAAHRGEVDIVKAKKFADLARKQNIKIYGSEIVDHCYEAGSPEIPSSDLPTATEKNVFKTSNMECWAFQTGIGATQDWNKYRKCLLSKEPVENNALAEIYANGWGVKRNGKLALALVCHGSTVPEELRGMVNTLYPTQNQERLETEFTFCNHVTSGMNSGFCTARAEEIASKKRNAEVDKLTKNWTDSQKTSFLSLKKFSEAFFSAHAVSEQDMSGTLRSTFAISAEAELREDLLKSINSFELGHLPKEIDFDKVDKELNDLYSRIMKNDKIGKMAEFGTITKVGIKDTQRKWLKYRDAWIKFSELKYPNIPQNVWKTWLTKQRIKQLQEFASE